MKHKKTDREEQEAAVLAALCRCESKCLDTPVERLHVLNEIMWALDRLRKETQR